MRVARRTILLLTVLLALVSTPRRSHATLEETLPMFHWSYRIIDELRLRGYFLKLFVANRPYTRGDIARGLRTIQANVETGRRRPTRAESGLLDQLNREFKDELDELAGRRPLYRMKLGVTGTFDGLHRSRDLERDDLIQQGVLHAGNRFREALRSKLSIGFGDHLTFHHSLRLDRNLTDDPRYIGKTFRGNAAFTEQAYVQGRYGPAHFKLGRDFLVLGSGKSGQLLISDNSRTFDLYSVDMTASFFKFTFFGIQLDDVALDSVIVRGRGPVNTAKRFLNGHRADFRLSKWGNIGISELALYGGPQRGFELAFVNPINFYHGSNLNDEQLGRPVNTLGSIDVDLFPRAGVELFGEFLIDDIKIETVNQSDLEPNKLAYLLGGQYADPFGLYGLELRTEYTRVSNRTFNSLFNVWERFLHRNRPIGYPLGNNFDRFEFGGSGWPIHSVFAAARYEYIRQGQDNVDSPYNTDFLDVPDVSLGYSEPFPFGMVQRTHAVHLTARFVPAIDLRFRVDLRLAHVSNFGFTPGRTRNQVQLFRIGVFFNYDRLFGWNK